MTTNIVNIDNFLTRTKEELHISISNLERILSNEEIPMEIRDKIFSNEFLQGLLNVQEDVIEDASDRAEFHHSVLIDYTAYELMQEVGVEKILEKFEIEYKSALEYLFGDTDQWIGFEETIEEVKNHIEENILKVEEGEDTYINFTTPSCWQGMDGFVHGEICFQIRTSYFGEYANDGLHESVDFEINKVWNLKQIERVEGDYTLNNSKEVMEEVEKRGLSKPQKFETIS